MRARDWAMAAAGALALAGCATAPPAARQDAPGAAYADFLIGRYADYLDDDAVAAERYIQALARTPRSPELFDSALYATLADGDSQRALELARLAQQRGVDVAAGRLVRAAHAMRAQRWAQAEAALDEVAGDSLEEMTARLLRIWVRAGQGDAIAAAQDFERISAPRPFDGVIAYQRALALRLAGRDEEALTAFAAARRSDIWLAPAALYEIDTLNRLQRGGDAAALFASAPQRLRDPGIAMLIGGERTHAPTLTPARGAAIGIYGLAALLLQEPNNSRGLTLLTLALTLDPDLDPARILFADGLRERERFAQARAALEKIDPASPYAETARLSAAWLLRREGRDSEALALAQRSAAEGGGRLSLMTVGDLHRNLEQWAEAEAVYTRIIDAIASPVEADWAVFFARGAARERMGRFEDAEADLQRALALSPDQPEVLNYLGYSWVDRGVRLDEGLEMIQRAVEMRPRSGHIIDSLGWAHYRLGDYDLALTYLERAVELEPADATLNDHLGDALWRLGRRIEARFQWSRALTLDPPEALRAQIATKLEAGLPPISPAPSAQAQADAR